MSAEIDTLVNALQAEVHKLTEALQEKDGAWKEAQDRSVRSLADLANYQRRTEEDLKMFREYATADLMKKLLPVLDHFDHAVKSLEAPSTGSGQADAEVGEASKKGVHLILKELWGVLSQEGLKTQEVVGHVFDPHRHEAVAQVERSEGPDGVIAEELRRGYEWKGKILRPAMVNVVVRKDSQEGKKIQEGKS